MRALSQSTYGMIAHSAGRVHPNFTAADYPGLITWERFGETSGTNLADRMALVTDLTLTQNGAGNAFANVGHITTSETAANEVYARGASAAPASLRALGSQVLLIEFDGYIPGTGTGSIIALGVGNSPSTQGWDMQWNGARARLKLRAHGSGTSFTTEFGFTPATVASQRSHCLIAWERSASDTRGTLHLYVDGVLVQSSTPSGDPGSIAVSTSGRLNFGCNNAVSVYITARYFNARVWHLSSFPANMAAIAAQMAATPDFAPTLMRGIS